MKNAEVIELGQQIFKDQSDWLDKTMRDILPPKLHYLISEGRVDDRRIQTFLEQNGVCLHFYRNSPMVRISRYGKFVAEFIPILNVDGRPVDTGKIIDKQGRPPEDIWADEN